MVQIDHIAVFGKHHILRIDARLDRDHAVGHQVTVLAVDRHGALRLDDVVHVQQLAFVAVAGDVHGGVVSVDHAGSELHELVDDLVDAMLVTWDQGAGEDHRVELVDGDVAVVAVGDAAERGHRLALGTGAHVDELVVLHVMGLLQVDDGVLGQTQVAQICCDGHVADHGTSDEHDLAAGTCGPRRRPAARGARGWRSWPR